MSETLSIVRPPSAPAISLGAQGEDLAVKFLESSGYRIVLTNFKVPVGRNSKGVAITGEIDIIALDGSTLCFVEVKTRRSDEFAPVISSVNARKQRQIIRTAKVYRRIFGIRDMEFRYDVAAVLFPKHAEPTIEITKGFYSEAKFRKKRWGEGTWNDFA